MATAFPVSILDDLNELSENEQDLEPLINHDDLDSVSKLQSTQRYMDLMQNLEVAALENMNVDDEYGKEYKLIEDYNSLSMDIDNEIDIVHNFIRDNYRAKFPELEQLVPHPLDYARVVKKIGNETDLSLVDLQGLLPSADIMVISLTSGNKQLAAQVIEKTTEACDRALALDVAKKKVLDFFESRMGFLAPNLSAIVGSVVAAKLIVSVGGLSALAKLPACNVQLLGAKKRKSLAGFSSATSQFHGGGYVEQAEIFKATPPNLRKCVSKILAAKARLAAGVDSARKDPSGDIGRIFRDKILEKIEKLQMPPPARQPKPLPVPVDTRNKKKRGGRRERKRKERYALTETRKLANRMQFGVSEESSLGDGFGEGYGILGMVAGSGKLRVPMSHKSKLAAKVCKKFKKHFGNSGVTSTLALSTVQGIELSNPQAQPHRPHGTGTQSIYFSETGTFSQVKRT